MWKIHVNPAQPNSTRNPIDPNPFLTSLKRPVFLPATHLTHNPINPTQPEPARCFAMSSLKILSLVLYPLSCSPRISYIWGRLNNNLKYKIQKITWKFLKLTVDERQPHTLSWIILRIHENTHTHTHKYDFLLKLRYFFEIWSFYIGLQFKLKSIIPWLKFFKNFFYY